MPTGTSDNPLQAEELEETHQQKNIMTSIKGNSISSMPAEHIELLRPIPGGKESAPRISESREQ